MSYLMDDTQDTAPTKGFSGKQVLLFVLGAVLLTAALSFWLIRTYIHPGDFKPVSLSAREQGQLDDKLRQLGVNPRELLPNAKREDQFDDEGRLVPEKYSEDPGKRDIRMSERELNALVANNPELAKRFAIDLSDNLASAKLLIPVDPDMPVLGGRILRVNAGIEVAYREERPVVKLRGISVMGVPVPNAWLGNLKNVDLVQEFGTGPGFWNSFAAGVDLIEVVDGQLHIKLRE
jgi:plasmid maintenance system antidote protein VapI